MGKTNFIVEIIALVLLTGGCSNVHVKENNLRQYRMIRKNTVFYTTFGFTQSIKDSIYKLDYSDSSLQTVYYLSPSREVNDKVIYNRKDTQQLFLADKRVYALGDDNFDIYKLIENKGVTDGEISLFWSPAYGILLERANTWRSIRKLIGAGSKEKDDTIAILSDLIFSDVDFYKNEVPNSAIKFNIPSVEKDH